MKQKVTTTTQLSRPEISWTNSPAQLAKVIYNSMLEDRSVPPALWVGVVYDGGSYTKHQTHTEYTPTRLVCHCVQIYIVYSHTKHYSEQYVMSTGTNTLFIGYCSFYIQYEEYEFIRNFEGSEANMLVSKLCGIFLLWLQLHTRTSAMPIHSSPFLASLYPLRARSMLC